MYMYRVALRSSTSRVDDSGRGKVVRVPRERFVQLTVAYQSLASKLDEKERKESKLVDQRVLVVVEEDGGRTLYLPCGRYSSQIDLDSILGRTKAAHGSCGV